MSFSNKCTSLKHIYIDDMKSLTDLSTLEFLKNLKSISIFSCSPAFEPECILPVLKNPSVKQCSFDTNSKQKNEKINAYIQQHHKKNDNNAMLIRNKISSDDMFL